MLIFFRKRQFEGEKDKNLIFNFKKRSTELKFVQDPRHIMPLTYILQLSSNLQKHHDFSLHVIFYLQK